MPNNASITLKELVARYGGSIASAHRAIAKGELPAVKLGPVWLIRLEDALLYKRPRPIKRAQSVEVA